MRWYAVMIDRDDQDWSVGSYDRDEAISKARQWRQAGFAEAYVALIEDGKDPVCIEEITEIEEVEE